MSKAIFLDESKVVMKPERADRYEAWQSQLAAYTLEQLIEAFNREVGNNGWGTARADYLHALRHTFVHRGVDCSCFLSDDGRSMSFKHRLALEDGRIVLAK
jgi:hypothetical protein